MRNLELLRDAECIEISMKEYRPDRGPLQQQKVCNTLTNTRTHTKHTVVVQWSHFENCGVCL